MNTVNLEGYVGDDFTLSIQYQDSDGDAASIAGFTFYLTGRTSPSAETAAFEKTVTSHDDEENGLTSITIARADTLLLTAGKYYYDLKYKDGSDKVHTACTGIILFNSSVKGAIA